MTEADLWAFAASLDSLAQALRVPIDGEKRLRVAARLVEIAASLRRPLELAGNQPVRKGS